MLEKELSFDDIEENKETESNVEELSFDDIQTENNEELSFDSVGQVIDETETTTPTATPAFNPPKEGFTYEQFQQSPELKAAAIRFAKDRLGYDNISEEEAIDETIEHFREFKVNELTAGQDWNYTSALAADNKRQQINDYKSLYRATESMDSFGGGVLTTLGDYGWGIVTAPSTLLGLLLPGGGKLAGVAAQQTAKLGVGRVIGTLAANPIKTIAGVEASAGALQDIAQQQSLMSVEEQDDYSFAQTVLSGTISGVAPAVVSTLPLYIAKKYGAKAISKKAQTEDLLATSKAKMEKLNAKADAKAEEVLTKGKDAKLGTEVIKRLKKLNEKQVEKGEDVLTGIAKSEKVDESLRVVIPLDKINRIGAATTELIAETGFRTFTRTIKKGKNKGKTLVEEERITEAIARTIREAKDNPDESVYKAVQDNYGKILEKYNLTQDDFANAWMAEFSEAGRLLSKAGHFKQGLMRMMNSIDAVGNGDIFSLNREVLDVVNKVKDRVAAEDIEGALKIFDTKDFLRSADALRLAAMTSQVATTVRNTVGGYVRVGIDTLSNAFDGGIQLAVAKAKGEKTAPTVKDWAKDAFAVAYGIINKDKAIAVEEIFAMGFQKKAQRLFRQLADLEDLTGVAGKKTPSKMRSLTTNVGRNLNVLNTLSDNMFKRAAFMGGLERELTRMKRIAFADPKRAGKVTDADFDLMEIMKAGKFNTTFGSEQGKKALDRAIEEALYFTYQASPKSTVGQLMIKGANNLPFLTTSLVPFPRFLANAMRFTYEYSPLFLMNKKVRTELGRTFVTETEETIRKFGVKSYHNTAKGLTGMGLLIAGYAHRETAGGEKWYEGKSEDGQTYDMRPFFPAAPYLFFGEILRRVVNGEEITDKKTAREALQAVTGMQVGKAGFGLYAMDKFVDDIGKAAGDTAGDPEEALYGISEILAEFGANILSTYTMPLTPFQDVYNTFIAPDDERIIRDNNIESLGALILHKTLARIPGNFAIEKMLHEQFGTEYNIPKAYQSPTREGLLRRTSPITRQVYGRLYQGKKTPVEKELDRLRITKSEVLRRTGIPEADEILGFYMGEIVTDIIAPYIKSDKYKRIPDTLKRKALMEEIAKVRKFIKERAKNTLVYNNANKATNPYDRVRFLRLPKEYRALAKKVYHQQEGEPASMRDYNYALLYSLAKQMSKTTLSNIEFVERDIEEELAEKEDAYD